MIDKLLYEEMLDINFKQFENVKKDDLFMDEWAKKLIEKIFVRERDDPVLANIKSLLMIADKQLYKYVRDKEITLNQFKARCMERLNANQFAFITHDDVIDLIHPTCRNIDL